jgi:hypothetical protein
MERGITTQVDKIRVPKLWLKLSALNNVPFQVHSSILVSRNPVISICLAPRALELGLVCVQPRSSHREDTKLSRESKPPKLGTRPQYGRSTTRNTVQESTPPKHTRSNKLNSSITYHLGSKSRGSAIPTHSYASQRGVLLLDRELRD